MINWTELSSEDNLQKVIQESHSHPVCIFKHSTRCGISAMVLHRLEQTASEMGAKWYLLDLLAFRSVSDAVSIRFGIEHQSPQLLLVSEGECVSAASHTMISANWLADQLTANH